MKIRLIAIALVLTAATAIAMVESNNYYRSSDGTLYIKGTFYKDVKTSEVFKKTGENKSEIILNYFDSGQLQVK